jgi:hypothetical protein
VQADWEKYRDLLEVKNDLIHERDAFERNQMEWGEVKERSMDLSTWVVIIMFPGRYFWYALLWSIKIFRTEE